MYGGGCQLRSGIGEEAVGGQRDGAIGVAEGVRSAGRAGSGGARQAGERAPTIRDVAASRRHVARDGLARHQRSPVRQANSSRARVERAMEELNYFPDASAQRLRSGSSRTVGFLMPDFTNGVNVVIAQEVEQAMQRAGYTVLLACSNFDPQVEIEALQKFHANRVDGIVLQTCSETHEGILETLARVRCPVVLVDRDMAIEADAVCSNHYDATREATRYLIGLGHEEIGFITANATMRPGRERHRGFVDEMAAHGSRRAAATRLRGSPVHRLRPERDAPNAVGEPSERDHRGGKPDRLRRHPGHSRERAGLPRRRFPRRRRPPHALDRHEAAPDNDGAGADRDRRRGGQPAARPRERAL